MDEEPPCLKGCISINLGLGRTTHHRIKEKRTVASRMQLA